MKGRCKTCRFSYIGIFNQPMVVAHTYDTEAFTFNVTDEDIIAVPKYEYSCEHESNWLPSRGDMLVHGEDSCKHYEPEEVEA